MVLISGYVEVKLPPEEKGKIEAPSMRQWRALMFNLNLIIDEAITKPC